MSFAEQFSTFSINVENMAEEKCRSIANTVGQRIVMRTPVGIPEQVDDPGHAKANWQASIGSPATNEIADADPEGAATVAKIQSVVAEWKPREGASLWITNNVPYIPVLEYGLYPSKGGETARTINGYSKQAPHGMVGITVAEMGGAFNGFTEEPV